MSRFPSRSPSADCLHRCHLRKKSAVRSPLARGLKVTLMKQLPPAATLLPQVLVWAKSLGSVPVIEIPEMPNGELYERGRLNCDEYAGGRACQCCSSGDNVSRSDRARVTIEALRCSADAKLAMSARVNRGRQLRREFKRQFGFGTVRHWGRPSAELKHAFHC
jgi:hypothetical protein